MKNYHNSEETFSVGSRVAHVTDSGEIVAGTVKGMGHDSLDIDFDDGDEGTELAATCFLAPARTGRVGGIEFESEVELSAGALLALAQIMPSIPADTKLAKVSTTFAAQLEKLAAAK